MLSRRTFTLGLAASFPLALFAKPNIRIVIVGAGAGGLSVAQGLLDLVPRSAQHRLELTLIEPQAGYCPPFGVHRVLAGLDTPDGLFIHYPRQWQRTLRFGSVKLIDRKARHIELADGGILAYDFLVLAPGLEAAESLPGTDHLAWFNDRSIKRLTQRLDALPPRAEIVMTVPELPHRCPPAPYERASLIASYLHRRGRRDFQITVLDAKPRFPLQAHFLSDWESRWPGRVIWLPPDVHTGIGAITASAVETGFDRFEADLLIAIPRQVAAGVCRLAELTDFTGYCPTIGGTMRSSYDDRVYVVGDAAKAGDMPKAASAAVAQGRIAAHDLAHRTGLATGKAAPAARSQCFSLLDAQAAISSASRFELREGQLRSSWERLSPYPLSTEVAAAEARDSELSYAATLAAMGLKN